MVVGGAGVAPPLPAAGGGGRGLLPAGGRGAGVAVAGFINPARDQLSYNPNLDWLVGFPLRDAMADALGATVALEVDSNASCLGEYRSEEHTSELQSLRHLVC